MDDEENIIKSKADSYNNLVGLDDNRLSEDGMKNNQLETIPFSLLILVRTDINAVIGEVNLLLRGKLKQFRGLCQSNVV